MRDVDHLDRFGPRFGDRLILRPRSAAYAYGSDNFPAPFQRNTAGEDHYLPVVRCVNSKKLLLRLTRSA